MELFEDGTQCVSGPVTMQTLIEMLQHSGLQLPIRFDEVLITPTMIDGMMTLIFEVSPNHRHREDDQVLVLSES